jgi:hypothetical protein
LRGESYTIDPGHGQAVPSGAKIDRLLRGVFWQQRQEAVGQSPFFPLV